MTDGSPGPGWWQASDGNWYPPPWEYEVLELTPRWSGKRHGLEMQNFAAGLTRMGAMGWELVSYQGVPLTGAFTSQIDSYAYIAIFKRPSRP